MRHLIILPVMLVLFAATAAAEMRIFHLTHRPAADIVDSVRAMVGDKVRVAAADHSLFVNASPAELSAVAELVGILDRPPAMLRIAVDQNRDSSDEGMQIDTSGGISIGSSTVILGRPEIPPRDGEIHGGRDRLRVGATTTRYQERRRVEQFVVTLEGRPARISVGRRIPFAERWLLLARRHAHVVETIHYESVDTGFEVRPDLVGSQVQLDIYPFMAFQDPQQPCEIVFQELATTVRVPLGEWYDLGGTMAGRDEVSREILGFGSRGGEGGGLVRVKVELQPN